MNKKRIKRKIMQKKIPFIIGAGIILLIAGFFIFNKIHTAEQPVIVREGAIEITTTDLFAPPIVNTWTAKDIAVKGVMLGDTFDQVIATLGYPDYQSNPQSAVTNVEYGKKLKLPGTGLIIQLKNNRVTRITIKKPFNQLLMGNTTIDHSKEEVYFSLGLGKPDNIFIVPEQALNSAHLGQGTSAKAFRLFQYFSRNTLEIIINKDEQEGLSFTSIPYMP